MSTPNESSTNDQATTFPYFNLRFSIEHVFFSYIFPQFSNLHCHKKRDTIRFIKDQING